MLWVKKTRKKKFLTQPTTFHHSRFLSPPLYKMARSRHVLYLQLSDRCFHFGCFIMSATTICYFECFICQLHSNTISQSIAFLPFQCNNKTKCTWMFPTPNTQHLFFFLNDKLFYGICNQSNNILTRPIINGSFILIQTFTHWLQIHPTTKSSRSRN